MDVFGVHFEREFAGNVIASLLAIVVLLVVRVLSLRFVINEDMPAEEKRRIVVNSRNAILIGVVFALVFVWAKELQTLALSAIAVAINDGSGRPIAALSIHALHVRMPKEKAFGYLASMREKADRIADAWSLRA